MLKSNKLKALKILCIAYDIDLSIIGNSIKMIHKDACYHVHVGDNAYTTLFIHGDLFSRAIFTFEEYDILDFPSLLIARLDG